MTDLRDKDGKVKRETYSKRAGNGVKTNVDLVYKVGWITNAHEWTSRVDIVQPTVEFFVVLQG